MHQYTLILLLIGHLSNAQIPRNDDGVFEYAHKLTLNDQSATELQHKARRFFNQPFLVHWQDIETEESTDDKILVKGSGYINIKAKYRSFSTPKTIPVHLQLVIEVEGNSYRYSFTHFEVSKPDSTLQFDLDDKPSDIKDILYDQVVSATHKRISFIIGWMKKYMADELEYISDQ